MFSVNFPSYSRSDCLNSLSIKCVHVLCSPLDSIRKNPTTTLYDLNIINRFEPNHIKAPCRLIEKLYEQHRTNNRNGNYVQKSLLDIDSRQTIIDYIIRERIFIRANFLIQILNDGCIFNLDLWQLSDDNNFNRQEIETIFEIISTYSSTFHKLTIGGDRWIYHSESIKQNMKKLFSEHNPLVNLKTLKIQEIKSVIDFISILKSCPNLKQLEIAEPSLKNGDIFEVSSYLSSNANLSICKSLRCVSFPSSFKEYDIMKFLAFFPNITHLKCRPFEELLYILEQSMDSSDKPLAENVLKILNNIRALCITHPMSSDMVGQLLKNCPKIEQLSLELQKFMDLTMLATKAPFLSKLELHSSPNQSISFREHVVPILEGCGQQIQMLSLINFDHIDLTQCARFCPNLQTFSAQCFTTITYQSRLLRLLNIKKPFSNLKYLRLRPQPNYALPVEISIVMVENSPNLRHIELYSCSDLTDENINQISKKNRLTHLQTFILRHGHRVTNETLCKLVSYATLLNNLVFHDCGLLPPEIKENQQDPLF